MRAVRYLLRVGGLVLAGGAVFFGLVLLLNSQALFNRYAELYIMGTRGSSTPAASSRPHVSANSASTHAPVGDEPMRESRAQASEPRPAPPAASSDAENAGTVPATEPQAASPAVVAKREGVAAIYVSNAESVAGVDASDRWVDVILTQHPGTGAALSEIVLENVRVVTMELIAAEDGIGQRSALHAVTLDVDAGTVKNLLLASRTGKLSLALHRPAANGRPPEPRPPANPEVADVPPVVSAPQAVSTPQAPDAPQVVNAPQVVSPPPVAAHDDEAHFAVVTVNRFGGKSSTYRVPRER